MLGANIAPSRGELGVETAIASGGFVFVGTDNAGEDDLWRFYNVTRGRDYIHLMFLRTLRFYLGRFNITGQDDPGRAQHHSFALRDLKADGDILGYEIKFTRDQNSPEQLRLGKFTINFAAEEAPVPLPGHPVGPLSPGPRCPARRSARAGRRHHRLIQQSIRSTTHEHGSTSWRPRTPSAATTIRPRRST
ncbi:MAG: hypothetical protein R3D68_21155 [Hyphomicrobiaceae bacterium]